ncbi:hypothetical protein L4C33_13490 [Vibrio makurazakiensis]|uniref:hypothetical protein n=1 Tax=Vibrio makurazakiensis TaxID=2910250 RepID=UPI003D1514A2
MKNNNGYEGSIWNFDFTPSNIAGKVNMREQSCSSCSGEISKNTCSTTCIECLHSESYMNQYRGYYPDEIVTALVNLDTCKRMIFNLIEQEKNGTELDVGVIFNIEVKVHHALILLNSISNKTEPVKMIYIICAEIRDLINSRDYHTVVAE